MRLLLMTLNLIPFVDKRVGVQVDLTTRVIAEHFCDVVLS